MPDNTPPTVQLLLRKCLAKDRKRRLHDIADARVDLELAIGDPSSSLIRLNHQKLPANEAKPSPSLQWPIAIGFALLACLLMAVSGLIFNPNPPQKPMPIQRVSMNLSVDSNLELHRSTGTAIQFSPDGSTLAFLAVSTAGSDFHGVYLRRLDQLEAIPFTPAQGADQFCFSPDGQWIGFRDANENTIKKAAIDGGSVFELCKANSAYGMDWSDEGWIVFAKEWGGLKRISDTGGKPEALTTLEGKEKGHRWPHVVPGGRALLYSAAVATGAWNSARIKVLHLPERKSEPLKLQGHHVQYLRSGYLVFARRGQAFGAAFDMETLQVKGKPVPLIQDVFIEFGGVAHLDLSSNGTFAYQRDNESDLTELAWVDREGEREPFMPAGQYFRFRLSPDGRSVAYSDEDLSIWIHDIERAVSTRLTFGEWEIYPVWSPSGESIVFASIRKTGRSPNLYWRRTDGSGETEHLFASDTLQFPRSWHPSGNQLIVYEETKEGGEDLRIVNLRGDDRTGWTAIGEPVAFQATHFDEAEGRFSPDGHWVAYQSNESGQHQVYVRRVDGGGKVQVSIEGIRSVHPRWSPNTNELLFGTQLEGNVSGQLQVFVAAYRIEGDAFLPEHPIPWNRGTYFRRFDLHPDGTRLLVHKQPEGQEKQRFDRVVLFQNFSEYLREQLQTDD